MKKITFIIGLVVASVFVKAQNVQLHYDFGEGREYLTSTIEKFAPDTYGSTYFFVDFNYDKNGPQEAYWEISRELKKWDAPFSVHVEYNGGLNAAVPFQINNAYLFGGTYSWNAEDFSKGFSLTAMYKNIQGKDSPHNFQLTGVWYLNMLNNKISFAGFADFWKEESDFDYDGAVDADFIFISEPQLWYNFNKSFSFGTEVELGYNFGGIADLKVCPTLGVKWSF